MTDKQPEAYAVPLHELLAKVPRSQRLEIEFNEGHGTSYIPVGRYCHEAAAELRRLHEVNAELVEAVKAALSDDQPYIEKCKAALDKALGDNNG